MFALISNLDRSRYNPFVLMPDDGSELGTELHKIGCNTFSLPLYPLKPKHIIKNFKNILRIRSLIISNQIAIIHPDCERDSIICGFAKSGTTCREVWHVRLTRPVKSDKTSARLADKIICISDACKFRFPGFEDKCATIFNGVDCNKFVPLDSKDEIRNKLNIPKDKFVISFVGQYKRGKGIIDLAKAINILKENDLQNVLLVMTGSVKEEIAYNEMLKFIADHGLENHISILQQQSEIYRYMQAADILILPSHEGVEGMGRVLFEAMACGTPVIGTNISGIREAITPETGILVKERAPEEIASAIIKFMTDSEFYNAESIAARRRALDVFDIKKHADRVMNLYDSVLQ